MTVAELIARLQELPQNLPVYTEEFDEGNDTPVTIVEVRQVTEMDKVEYVPNHGWVGPIRTFDAVKIL